MDTFDSLRGRRVLVTGGAGFIGSHLVVGLVEAGADVVVLDDLSSGRRENLAPVAGRVELVVADVQDHAAVLGAMEGVDVVFHQAAIASVPRSILEAPLCAGVNLGGTGNVLDAAVRAGVKKVVVASSSAVYGDADGLSDLRREEAPFCILSPYAAHKAAAELLCQAWSRSRGLQTVCLRYFNIYGPRQDPHSAYAGVIPLFAQRLLAGLPLKVFGDGLQTRDFVYVSDVVRANLLAATRDHGLHMVCNVGSGHPTTVLGLAQVLARLLGRPLEVELGPPREGDIRFSCADVTRARERLLWSAQVPFDVGLSHTLEWLRAT